jgi:hypothetical protein
MMLRAVSVVYKGSLSGSWIDIVDRGRYGMGFRTIGELTDAIDYVMNACDSELFELQEKALRGSQRFPLITFKRNFLKLIEGV